MQYTNEAEIRRKVEANATAKERSGRPMDADVVKRFIEQRIDTARKSGLLMTDRQLDDYKRGRMLRVGDRARYIGEPRTEKVKLDDGREANITRTPGQEGAIVSVVKRDDDHIFTFRPTPNPLLKDEVIVELQVREHTAGWLDLERVT